MHIMIATPSYGGMGPDYVGTVMRLQRWLVDQRIEVTVAHHSMAEVARSRNILASLFLEQQGPTHLLFIDSDMAFEPEVVGALIRANKPLVGCVYPKRGLDLDRLIAAARRLEDRNAIIASAMDFVVTPKGPNAEIVDGLCEVRGLGMGLCLIAREVFEGLRATGRIKEDLAGGRGRLRGPILGFFDYVATETTFLGEDLSFCERWSRLCGGQVWAVVDQEIGHVGEMTFKGRLIDAFAAAAQGR